LTTPRFYVSTHHLAEGRLALRDEDHHHLSRVLRMRVGEHVQLLDGEGMLGYATITEITSDATTVDVMQALMVEDERPRMHLFQALPQGTKMDQVVQWGVELGAAEVIPYSSLRSRRIDVAAGKRVERWRRIAYESCRVAGRPFLARVHEPLDWEEALSLMEDCSIVLYADEEGGEMPSAALGKRDVAELGLVIGPEGGFTDVERDELAGRGAIPVTLGRNVLRTETAGLVLMASVRCHFGLL
jgi:16S rRNA (uracil1498-N3)-methyltransferase